MTFALRSLVLALASFGVAALISSIVVALIWRTPEGTAARRAGRLWRMRLLPTTVAIATGVFVVLVLWRFEGRHDDEQVGWIVQAAAAMGALFLGAIVMRLLRMHLDTRRLLATWVSQGTRVHLPAVAGCPCLTVPAYRITTHFPVVAVIGILRPTLVVDASVLDTCSPEQLASIVAHEQGHLRRWDNLRRALFSAAPDLLAWTSVGPALRDAWREATEEAADDIAAELGEAARVNLADALLRVARIAQGTAAAAAVTFNASQLPASALYRGESIDRRVRRLLRPTEASGPAPRPWGLALVASAAALGFVFQQEIHDLLEVAVNSLW